MEKKMEMSGEQRIPASREDVWKALNSPKVLRKCIPGCESIEATSPTEMIATIKVHFGPLSKAFKSTVRLEDLNAPESFTIRTDGGIAKASTDVSLREENGETVVSYAVKAKIAGKLAILGSGVLRSSAKKIVAQFFNKFKKVVVGREPSEA
jgi:carbon monoxide dehydrogenase subunit G